MGLCVRHRHYDHHDWLMQSERSWYSTLWEMVHLPFYKKLKWWKELSQQEVLNVVEQIRLPEQRICSWNFIVVVAALLMGFWVWAWRNSVIIISEYCFVVFEKLLRDFLFLSLSFFFLVAYMCVIFGYLLFFVCLVFITTSFILLFRLDAVIVHHWVKFVLVKIIKKFVYLTYRYWSLQNDSWVLSITYYIDLKIRVLN